MRYASSFAVYFFLIASSFANDIDLARKPNAYIGERVQISAIQCIDDPRSGFFCIKSLPGRYLSIRARFMGAFVRQSLVEHLVSACKGSGNLGSELCKFDIEIIPTEGSATTMMKAENGGEIPLTIVRSDELYLLRRAP